jgi:hypothetical protein
MSLDDNPPGSPRDGTGPQYSSDRSGLVHAFLFEAGNPAVSANFLAVSAWLQQPASNTSPSFAWLHFSLANTRVLPGGCFPVILFVGPHLLVSARL